MISVTTIVTVVLEKRGGVPPSATSTVSLYVSCVSRSRSVELERWRVPDTGLRSNKSAEGADKILKALILALVPSSASVATTDPNNVPPGAFSATVNT